MKPTSAIPTYVGKGLAKIWRRSVMEWSVEWPLLCDKWRIILLGLIFQYFHGIGAKSAHYLHHPGPVLHDVGFDLIPELGKKRSYWSEWAFLSIVLPFIGWTFSPFVCQNKRFYTALLWPKVLVILCMCQLFRMLSFTSTQLPGPNYHCREGSPSATLPPLTRLQDLVILDFKKAGMFGCGDLIFSSHMTFTITSVLTYNKYGTLIVIKVLGWLLLVIQSLLIVASRKHYTVDVVIAWYVVPLVFYFVDHYLSDSVGQGEALDLRSDKLGDRSFSSPLLPIKMDGMEYSLWLNGGVIINGRSHSIDRQRTVLPSKGEPESNGLEASL